MDENELVDRLLELAEDGKATELQQLATASNCNSQDSQGYSPLMAAASASAADAADCVRLLLSLGADPLLLDSSNQSALHHAASAGNADTLRLLLQLPPVAEDVDAVSTCGDTALMLAARRQRPDAVGCLLDAAADPDRSNDRGQTARSLATGDAAAAFQTHRLLQLVQAGQVDELRQVASSSSCNVALNGLTPLMAAAQCPNNAGAACAEQLLKIGADVHRVGTRGLTALHCAAESNSGEVVQLLLDAGADANAKDNNGDTPLMAAAARDSADAAKLLICNGSNVFLPNSLKRTAFDVATAAPSDSILQLLQEALGECLEPSTKVKFLGRGSYGNVHAVRAQNGLLLARKKLKLTPELKDSQPVQDAENEATILRQLRHQNIVRFVQLHPDSAAESVLIFTELVEGCSLTKTIGKQPLTEDRMRHYGRQILDAVAHLHSLEPRVYHRDIKGDNVLIDCNDSVKLIDFGLSVKLEVANSSGVYSDSELGTQHFLSPEILSTDSSPHRYSRRSDVWAVGCTVYQMASGRVPYHHCANPMHLSRKIVEKGAPPLPDGCSESLRRLYSCCVEKEPERRLLADQLLQLDFFQPA